MGCCIPVVTINDPVHKTIEIHPLCLKIIDTPEFQRLRDIKQCGVSHLVYPSAVHSRFEHSIGVYYLASQMVDSLMKKYGDPGMNKESTIKISPEDRLCVMIAALCHDLGHGPFSHLWETFIYKQTKWKWRHEDMSTKILKHLIEKNNLKGEFSNYNLDDIHINFIIDIIAGNYEHHKDKRFLFEIVANKETNIDVDRWDYMLRDAYFFGIICPVEYRRILSYMKIRKTVDGNRIEFRDKVYNDLLEIFVNRIKLHRVCYQHRVSKTIEQMLIDALIEADNFFFTDRQLNLSSAHEDIDTFLTLSDGLIYNLLHWKNEKLSRARDILLKILTRKFYKLIFQTKLKQKIEIDGIKEKLESALRIKDSKVELRIIQFELSMGTGGNDPFKNVLFYKKDGSEMKASLPEECKTMELNFCIFSVNDIDVKLVEDVKTLLPQICPEFNKLN
ncbi:deoxynucleoside triphosphate triphosphohydrolase SAMHD1 isoform X2 [Halyomorpha halys]|uniref:deoxynucleoside triphosphate triphosphohydrolase SAMHD1 isoform X2 n=1 Tax=Halyomorpha halys TaxID=286706 RepID=UPI0006D5093B|nr:deoxynucleoside triphosphate triphosphohydrolase SAMHD1 isoform X2 [Halyomorpha halys]